MYKTYYGLKMDPFIKDVNIKNHYTSKDFKEAISRLEFLKNTKGFGLLTGEPGVGKSFLLRYFINSLNTNLFKCVYIPISTLTVMDFYRALCNGLGLNPAHKKIEMFKQIQEAIYNYKVNKNITPVIIIDEAQFLKNSLLDDLRLIFNFQVDSKDYSILILSGQTPFITQINRQTHEALRQRIVVNYNLKGLSKEETKDYINTRLEIAGCHDSIFTESAYELLYSSSNGCLRVLNTLAKMSLISGANQKLKSIDNEIIYQAQKELNIIA
ncbi:MAG: AAA family ATPase [Firmicutes bacterium]|nr:AAA family ATPase [Bacillota bacterium]